MRCFTLLLGAAALAAAQSVIDYSKIPDCAHQCTVLAQAEANCVPPAAPVTSQTIYQSCLCQSTLLVTLHSSGQICLATGCSTDDASKISQYYIGLCNGPVVQPSSTTTGAAATSATGTKTSAAGTGTATAAGAGSNNQLSASNEKKSWWAGHWKWVVMVIVIFIAIIFFWVGGAFLRRRYARKHAAERANMAAKDASFTPGSKSAITSDVTPLPVTMSGGRNGNGMHMDGGIGGIAAPRGPRVRSRTNTLQSLRLGNDSRTSLPQPVVWGPHQHLAHAHANGNHSPSGSVPPSPTMGLAPPNPIFRNREGMRSHPEFGHYRGAPTQMSHSSGGVSDGSSNGASTIEHVNWGEGQGLARPHTSQEAYVPRSGPSRSLNAVRSDPILSPHLEGESAEICQVTPEKSRKPGKLQKGGG